MRRVAVTKIPRAGVSLLEVLIATSILFGAVVVLMELAQIGRRHAESAAEQVVAQQLCQRKLNELLLGLAPLAPVSGELEDMPGWAYAVDIQPVESIEGMTDLVRVEVTVQQDPQATDERPRKARFFQIARWMRQPPESLDDRTRPDPTELPTGSLTRPLNAPAGPGAFRP